MTVWKGRINAQTGSTSLVSERNMRVHLERRKPWNKGLSSSSIREYEPILRNRIFQLVESLQEKSAGKHFVELVEWISMFSQVDFIYSVCLIQLMRISSDTTSWAIWRRCIYVQRAVLQ